MGRALIAVALAASLAGAQLTPGNYVVVDEAGIVWEVAPGGAVTTFFRFGAALHGVDFDASGNLVCGTGAGAVVRITPAAQVTTVFSGGPLSGIVGDIEVTGAGTYLVPAWSGVAVLEITPAGAVVTFHATPGLCNWGLGLDEKAGHLFVTGDHTLLIQLGTGAVRTLVPSATALPFPQCGNLGPSGTFVVGDQMARAVFEVDAAGVVTTLLATTAFGDVGEGLDWDRDHAYILADDQAPGSNTPCLFRLDVLNALTTIAILPGADLNGCAAVPELVTVPLTPEPQPGSYMAIGLHSAGAPFKAYMCASSLDAKLGIPLPGNRVLPLDFDNLVVITAQNLLPQIFVNYQGILDASGRATLLVHIPPEPALAGITIYTAGITLDPHAPGGVHLVSTPLPFTIQK
ncbi:MAG: hypothetical protein JXQ29_15455 [Planctomycetes bacterium]|nr:hypothetical protein [Planctomycetota bacterium]